MNLVDEQYIVGLEIGQQCRQILGLFQHRAAGLAQVHAQLGRDDVGQRGLAQTGRAEQQHMIERLAAFLGSADKDFKLLAGLGLAHILIKQFRAQRAFQRLLALRRMSGRHHARRQCLGFGGHASGLACGCGTGRKFVHLNRHGGNCALSPA